MKKMVSVVVCMLFLGVLLPLQAQDVEDNISNFSSKNGGLYLEPLADAFGASINSGFFHSAKIERTGFHVYLGLHVMAAPISEDQKTFTAVSEGDFNPPPNTVLPTVFGSNEEVEVEGIDGEIAGVLDTNWFPFAVPQLTVGSLFGTELTLRWFEMKLNDDIGKIKLFSWGVRHSVSQYIPLMPVDVAVGYFRQSFSIGDYVDASAWYAGLQASYSVSILCFYTGFGYESATLGITYKFTSKGETTNIKFDLDSVNSTRFTIGLALDLPIIKIHADYNIAKQSVFKAGIGFGI